MIVGIDLERDRRNADPTAEALVAMCIWGAEYAAQGGGSMEFWDRLNRSRKDQCRRMVDRIRAAKRSKP